MAISQKYPYTGKEVLITRTFDAPIEKVWKAWTDAQSFQKWWGPKGSAVTIMRFDLKPDGMCLYNMAAAPGQPQLLWAKFVYKEVDAPNKLVFINAFSDENGGTTGNPWIPVWPLEIINELTLEEQDGKTLLTLRGHPINASAEEIKAFEGAQAGMEQGFAGTWEKLDQFLAA
ncbi:MAG TPA: SRPBCC domain-containing protein [Candidatus Peribacteraceae bacterium]|nr:SRPBCC domain-containing protein [Candidatus Peribacteraceae bacterium]